MAVFLLCAIQCVNRLYMHTNTHTLKRNTTFVTIQSRGRKTYACALIVNEFNGLVVGLLSYFTFSFCCLRVSRITHPPNPASRAFRALQHNVFISEEACEEEAREKERIVCRNILFCLCEPENMLCKYVRVLGVTASDCFALLCFACCAIWWMAGGWGGA